MLAEAGSLRLMDSREHTDHAKQRRGQIGEGPAPTVRGGGKDDKRRRMAEGALTPDRAESRQA